MATDRDRALLLLAEILRKHCPGCSEASNGWDHPGPEESAQLAAAILDTEGVEVREQVGTYPPQTEVSKMLGKMHEPRWIPADDHYGIPATHRRLVIMLPAEET